MVKTIACCPYHLVRVTSTLAVGKVAKIARWWLPVLSCCLATHCVFFLNAVALLSYLSCCLAHALSARCLPSSWPDTASFRSCLLMPPGFLDTREAGTCAGSRACVLLLSLLDSFCTLRVPNSPMQVSSSNFGSLHGSGSDLDGMGTRPLLSQFAQFKQ